MTIHAFPFPDGTLQGFIDLAFTPELADRIPEGAVEGSSEQRDSMLVGSWRLTEDGAGFEQFTPPPPPRPTTISARDFLSRFSDEEEAAIAEAAMSSPVLLLWFMRLNSGRRTVDLRSDATRAEVRALVEAGILTAERAVEVLE